MNHEFAREIWQRLSSYEIDDPGASYPFSARLAKENGWSRSFARRVIEEYKRYLLLCLAADHIPCPSEHVDQAWHLHLTYTRSYWKHLCGEILGRPVHHEPTRGGPEEHHKHVQMYEQTLAAYREFFGHEPPVDIWTPAPIRFGDDVEHERVNVRRNWIVPKWIFWPLSSRRSAALTGCLALLPLGLAALSPFDWTGPFFLVFYVVVYLLVVLLGIVLRNVWRSSPPQQDYQELSPQDAACLAYNSSAAINATICQMVQQGALQLVTRPTKFLGFTVHESKCLAAGDGMPTEASRLEQDLFKVAKGQSTISYHDLHNAGAVAASEIETRLVERGLLETPESTRLARWLPFALMMLVMLMGIVKIGVGLWRDKPVIFLIIGSVVALMTAFFFLKPIRRTGAGNYPARVDADAACESLRARRGSRRGIGRTQPLGHGDGRGPVWRGSPGRRPAGGFAGHVDEPSASPSQPRRLRRRLQRRWVRLGRRWRLRWGWRRLRGRRLWWGRLRGLWRRIGETLPIETRMPGGASVSFRRIAANRQPVNREISLLSPPFVRTVAHFGCLTLWTIDALGTGALRLRKAQSP